jgi:hypothetical protein
MGNTRAITYHHTGTVDITSTAIVCQKAAVIYVWQRLTVTQPMLPVTQIDKAYQSVGI